LAFAVLLAVLLLPIVNFLESRNVPRILFIAISLFLAIIAGVGNTFSDDITGTKKVRIYERIKVLKIKKTNKPVKPPISY